MTTLFLTIGWFLYYALHSVLADLRIKAAIIQALPWLGKYYRLVYNIISLAGLVGLSLLSISEWHLIYEAGVISQIVGFLFLIGGFWIVFQTVKNYDLPEFMGFKSSVREHTGASEKGLITTGLYGYMRHPLYTGTTLFCAGIFFLLPGWPLAIFIITMCIYLPIGIHFEEKKLIREFGEDYIRYQKEVSRLIPGLY